MVVVKILVPDKELGQAVADSILKNKFSIQVFGNSFDSYKTTASKPGNSNKVYVIQFITKSMLFHQIEDSLKQEFPKTDFSICATPIVHIGFTLHDRIKNRVIGFDMIEAENED
ncbi:MAG: hypothetical protein SGI83_15970 [Bacteroidota bacterium]|nr:hypothetical protein [Bacteroidota bacterium]